MRVFLLVSTLILYTSSSAMAGEHLATAADVIAEAKSDCAKFEDGKFAATDQAITLYDLTGDGKPEELIDASQFSCSTSASMWGGSGGTVLWVLVAGKKHDFLAHKWRVVDVDGQQVLLLAVHSSECSDTVGPCYRALVWSDGFRTIR
jgi:hypothetical protein